MIDGPRACQASEFEEGYCPDQSGIQSGDKPRYPDRLSVGI